jgi:hypothetical protein
VIRLREEIQRLVQEKNKEISGNPFRLFCSTNSNGSEIRGGPVYPIGSIETLIAQRVAKMCGVEFKQPVFSIFINDQEDNLENKIERIIRAIYKYNQAIQNLATLAINL